MEPLKEPLSTVAAKRLAGEIIADGYVSFSKHASEEMKKDQLSDQDALNVLRAGVCESAEHESGSWRYRFRTAKMYFVVAFRSESELRVVTGWRLKR